MIDYLDPQASATWWKPCLSRVVECLAIDDIVGVVGAGVGVGTPCDA